jgi:hypothetical protein
LSHAWVASGALPLATRRLEQLDEAAHIRVAHQLALAAAVVSPVAAPGAASAVPVTTSNVAPSQAASTHGHIFLPMLPPDVISMFILLR